MCQTEVTTSNVLGFSEIQYFPASLWISAKHYRSSGILQKLAWLVLKPWRETTQVLLKFLYHTQTLYQKLYHTQHNSQKDGLRDMRLWTRWLRTRKREWMRTREVDSITTSSWLGIYLSHLPEAHLFLEAQHPLNCFLGMVKCKVEWKEEVLLTFSELWWPCMDFRGLWSFWIPIFIL